MRNAISGIVLAGGRGRRMGEVDKGWLELGGRPLIQHVLDRFAPQVDDIVISANRNLERYRALGFPVVADVLPDFAGPLAGLHAALPHTRHPLAACVPCDSPAFPLDLVERLRQALEREKAQIAVPQAGGRVHPVFCLVRRDVWDSLAAYLAGGGRKVGTWHAGLRYALVAFDEAPGAFLNINQPEDGSGAHRARDP
jgi:molybdopterin-guanine dinucleotide biosynthesis protein A